MIDLHFKNRIQLYGQSLSPSEKRVTDYVLQNLKEATNFSSAQLAKVTKTSNATITRFCQKLMYRNYIEFQTLLAREADSSEPISSIERVRFYYQKILDSTQEFIQAETIKKFTSKIQKAKRILICGIGSSGMTANEFSSHLLRMGINASPANSSHVMITQASLLSKEDLLIAISNSGTTLELIKTCEAAHDNHVPLYALTQNNHTILTDLSDEVLFVSKIQETDGFNFINSQLPLLFLIDILSYELLKDDVFRENYFKTLSILAAKRKH